MQKNADFVVVDVSWRLLWCHLEHIACLVSMFSHHHLSQIRNLSPTAKDILASTVISRHHHLTYLTMLSWTSKWLLLF